MPQIELLKIHTHAGVEHGVGQAATAAEPRRSRHNEATPVSPLTSHKE